MRTVIETSVLRKALNTLATLNFGDSADAIYVRAIKLIASGNLLTMISLNRDMLCQISLPAKIEEQGEIIIDSSQADTLLKGVKSKETTIYNGNNSLIFDCGFTKEIKIIETGKFKVIPTFEPSTVISTADVVEISSIFKMVQVALPLSSDIVNDDLRDCNITIGKNLTVTALNGYVLCQCDIGQTAENLSEASYVLNSQQVSSLSKALGFLKGTATISIYKKENGQEYMVFKPNPLIVIAVKLGKHDYPDVKKLMGGKTAFEFTFPVDNLKQQLKGISGLGSAKNVFPAFINFEGNTMSLRIVTENETARISEQVTITGIPENFKIVGKVIRDAVVNAASSLTIKVYENGKVELSSSNLLITAVKMK